MKKILLINTNTEQHPYPVAPVGLCLLAASLEKKYTVKIFDGMLVPYEKLASEIQNFGPDYIGAGIRNIDNMTADNMKFYVDDIITRFIIPLREVSRAPLILGGSGFSLFPLELMKLTGADFGIAGEAELSLPMLLECLNEDKPAKNIPGLFIKNMADNDLNAAKYSWNQFPHSDIDLRLHYQPYLQRSSYPVQTKRGCIHKCIYCSYPLIEGTQFRRRDPADIALEIEQVYSRLGKINFEFVDSTFNDPKGHAEEICRQIIKRKIPVTFRTMGINPVNVTPELIHLMKEAGFRQIDCTPDTASERMLVSLKKNFKKQHIIRAAKLFRDAEMPVMWFFLLGGPGENMESIKETEDFITENVYQWDMAHLSAGMRIYPGTCLYKIAIKENKISKGDNLLKPVYYQPDALSLYEINKLILDISMRHHNCVPSSESSPPPEMIQRAIQMQKEMKTPEPMFRTLLRVRNEMMTEN